VLFSVVVSELEEWLRRRNEGGVVVGRCKIFSLMYADDIVLIADEVEELKGMIKTLEKFLDKRKLELNLDKSKIVVFGKGKRYSKKERWLWKGGEIERVEAIVTWDI
jgi:hypothetical protein